MILLRLGIALLAIAACKPKLAASALVAPPIEPNVETPLVVSTGSENDVSQKTLAKLEAPDNQALLTLIARHGATLAASEKKRITDEAQEVIDRQLTFRDAVLLWNAHQAELGWEFLLPALTYKLAKIYAHVRDFQASRKMLALIQERYPQSSFGAQAREFSLELDNRFKVDMTTIGVVLPLSGKYQRYGETALWAIRLAFANTPNINLEVKDSQADPNIASQNVEELVQKHHAALIIGPLFSSEAMAAATKAEELNVPLLSLSHHEALTSVGAYIFQTAVTVRAQAESLANVAFNDLGFRRFAFLYPRTRYGMDFVQAFWDEVERLGGEIRGVESYEHDATTFQTPIRQLVGRLYRGARHDYYEMVQTIKAQNLTPQRQHSLIEKLDKALPPIIDFDALIIPDSANNLGLIAPALAFEDIVMEHDPKQLELIRKALGRDAIRPLTLMGGSTWNSAQTPENCERYCEDAIFVDAFYPDSPEAKIRDFVAAFREKIGSPPALSDALAYDTAKIAQVVISNPKITNRGEAQDLLKSDFSYDGLTGKITFVMGGQAKRQLRVLTIKNKQIVLWQLRQGGG